MSDAKQTYLKTFEEEIADLKIIITKHIVLDIWYWKLVQDQIYKRDLIVAYSRDEGCETFNQAYLQAWEAVHRWIDLYTMWGEIPEKKRR